MRYFEGEDVIEEARRADMERDAEECLLDEADAARPRCAECSFCILVREVMRDGGEFGLLDPRDRVPLCMADAGWPLALQDAQQRACECFEPR